jgi:hypothetical protein
MSRQLLKIFIFIFCLLLLGGKGMAFPPPPEIKTVATFIFINNAGKFLPNGSGFFVGLKNFSKNNFSVYLVTAKNVLSPPGATQALDKIYLLLNKKEGDFETVPLPLQFHGEKKNVFFHPDPTVDLAVMPVLPDRTKYDLKFIPDESLLTRNEATNLIFHEGTEVFFPSLFLPYTGTGEMFSCVRLGSVALVTDKKIDWQGKPAALYIIETGSYGGNSGAPVFFFSERNPVPGGQPAFKLAGIMQGTFGDAPQEIKIIEQRKTSIPFSNVGFSAVIPAYKLYELLFSEELKRKRGF